MCFVLLKEKILKTKNDEKIQTNRQKLKEDNE